MKFSQSLSLIALVAPLLSVAAPAGSENVSGVVARQGNGRQGGGQGQGQNNGQGQGQNNGQGQGQNNAGNNGQGQNNGGNNGANNGGNAGGNAQTSTTLDPSVIAKSFTLTGQETPTAGQSESITSTNNFINFCVGKTITDGKQIKEGSCNPCPIGDIPSFDNMPSAKFLFPANGDTSIQPNTAFTVKMNIQKIQTGVFTNAQVKYFAAPQQLNGQGQIIGHTHFTIEKLNDGLGQTAPGDPRNFAFFKGVNDPDAGGVASAAVDDGLPAGAYRICSINAAANHQPVIVPVAQHGSLDDCAYFTIGGAGGNGAAAGGNGAAAGGNGAAAGGNGAAAGGNGAAAGGNNNNGQGQGQGQQGQGQQGQGQQGQGQQGQGQQGQGQQGQGQQGQGQQGQGQGRGNGGNQGGNGGGRNGGNNRRFARFARGL